MIETITWEKVPGWFNFDDVYQEAVDRAPRDGAHFVEVGVLFGKSALFMAEAIRKSGKKIALDAVDTFALSADALEKVIDQYRLKRPQADHSRLREIVGLVHQSGHAGVVERVLDLSGLAELIHIVCASGQIWGQSYDAESLDFAYVDALHTYEDTAQILKTFAPKMRPGGVLAGHDYDDEYPGVRDAVRDVLGTKIVVRRQSFVWTK